jgi:LysM repeat protein
MSLSMILLVGAGIVAPDESRSRGAGIGTRRPIRRAACGRPGDHAIHCRGMLPLLLVLLAGNPSECSYTVGKGDTLSRIAVRHGVTEKELVAANPALKKNPDMLRLGQELNVCPGNAGGSKGAGSVRCGSGGRVVEHEVRAGDTLSKIAKSYGVTESAIKDRNAKLAKNPDALRVGQTVEVCVAEGLAKKSKACNFETPLYQHVVVPGEHLGQIAGRYGVRRGDLLKLNPRLQDNPNMLTVGQTVSVCPEISPRERERIAYTVQAGDTFGEIAQRYGLTRRELQRYQQGKLADTSSLRDGQKLVVWVDGGIVDGFARETDKGVLRGGVQLPPGRGYHVKWSAAAWGTAGAIRSIQTAVSSYQRKMPGGPKIHVGDISKRGGGKFGPHISHQHGRDVDVGYVLEGESAAETRFRSANANNLDVGRTWTLVKAFIDTNNVTYIFMDYRIQKLLYEYAESKGVNEDVLDELFQYPRGRGRTHGLIRHWRGHTNHFHVRFRK